MLVSIAKHTEAQTERTDDSRLAKRRAKVRSAWIAFAGRIVAQILGAAATIGFALIVFDRPLPAAAGDVDSSTPAASTPNAGVPVLAVLPFHTYAATSDHNHLAGALTELLLTELAQGTEIKITSATSAMRYQGATATIPEIGRQLGLSHVVEGSITVSGGRARVIAQLIDAKSDQHLWARSYETTIEAVLAADGRVAREIAREVEAALIAARR